MADDIIIGYGAKIGRSSAEADDEFLFDCFIEHPLLQQLRDVSSPETFLYGRTGVGKTAFLRKLENDEEHVSSIDLQAVALDYVANSDIINFLSSLELNLDIFFQALWKHVLLLEYIKLRYNVTDEGKSKTVFEGFVKKFKKNRRMDSALDYLQDYQRKFWISADESVRELTEGLEESVSAELGAEIEKFKANAGYARTLKSEKKSNVQQRAKKFIDSKLLAEQSKVLDLLKAYNKGRKGNKAGKYYILIDGLDDNWVDDELRYQLIRSLIECQKTFGKVLDLKLLVTIRADIFERVLQVTDSPGSQRDKYNDYLSKIQWNNVQLRELVDKRINTFCKRKYTSKDLYFKDLFVEKVGTIPSFKYILDRTLMRPRDIILFINEALHEAVNSASVTAGHIRSAEQRYSRLRKRALVDEWKSALPSIDDLLGLLTGQKARITIADLTGTKNIQDVVLKLSELKSEKHDPIVQYIFKTINTWGNENEDHLLKLIASELYRTGAIGLKLTNNDKHSYSYKDTPMISPRELSLNTRIHIHQFLHPALNINSKSQSKR